MRVFYLIVFLILSNISYSQSLDSKILRWSLQKDDENKKIKEIVSIQDTIITLKENKIIELYNVINTYKLDSTLYKQALSKKDLIIENQNIIINNQDKRIRELKVSGTGLIILAFLLGLLL